MTTRLRALALGTCATALLASAPPAAAAAPALPDVSTRGALELLDVRALRDLVQRTGTSTAAPGPGDDEQHLRSEDCYGTTRSTSGSDGTTIDVAAYGMYYACAAEDLWTLALSTYDTWPDHELYDVSLYADVDRSAATGCGGIDRIATAFRNTSGGFSTGTVRVPGCDTSTWAVVGEAHLSRASSNSLGLSFTNRDLGDAPAFDWFATVESLSDQRAEGLPAAGLHTESGFRTFGCTPASRGYVTHSTQPGVEQALLAAGATRVQRLHGGVVAVDGPLARLAAALRSVDAAARLERDTLLALQAVPNDPSFVQQWELRQVGAEQAWDITRGSSDAAVAVIDSGVDGTHPDLQGQVLTGYDAAHGVLLPAGSNSDVVGHGTAVAGVVAAATDNGAGISALGYRTRVLPVRVAAADGSVSSSALAAGVRWAADAGSRVLNVSIGSCRQTSVVAQAVSHAQARGALVVAAAGNDGHRDNTAEWPASQPGVLSVGATGRDGQRAFYSTTNRHVDLVAPGGSGDSDSTADVLALAPGNRYERVTGTSFSAPYVAAAAALVLSVDPSASAGAVADKLLGTARDLGPAGRDDLHGAGLLDAAAAVRRAVPSPAATPAPAPTASASPASGGTTSPTATPSPTPSSPAPGNVAGPTPAPLHAPRLRTSTGALVHGGVLEVRVATDPGRTVDLLLRSPASGPSRVLRTGTADELGQLSFRVQPSANGRYSAVVRASDGRTATSAPEDVAVAPRVSLAATRTGTRAYRFSGALSVRRAGVVVVLNNRLADGRLVALGSARTTSSGAWSLPRTFTRRGAVSVVAVTRGDSLNRSGSSRAMRLDVR